MPHIYINEVDNTVASAVENFDVVYIPGAIEENGTLEDEVPTLFVSANKFREALTGSKSGAISAENANAKLAEQLISLGLPVLFESFGKVKEIIEESGMEPVTVILTPEDIIAQVDFEKLADKGLFSFKFISAGAAGNLLDEFEEEVEGEVITTSFADKMIACAAKRGDCIALIDHKKEFEAVEGKTFAEQAHGAFSALLARVKDAAKFAAAFTPWCEFSFGTFPGSSAFLSSYAQSIKNNPSWYAAAGSVRGQIPAFIRPLEEFGDADCLILQAREINPDGSFNDLEDNKGFAINPICNIRPFGYIVWGNRTLVDNEETNGLSASSFLNIRNLCCDIKKTLYIAAHKFTFEQNSDILFVNFKAEITPLLDRALSGNGIRGYRIIKQSTDVKARLKATVRIVPIEAVEDFELTVEMTDSTEEVSENA